MDKEYVLYRYSPYENDEVIANGPIERIKEVLNWKAERATPSNPFYADDYEIYEIPSIKIGDLVKRNPDKHIFS